MIEPTYLPPLNQEAALQKREEIDLLLGLINTHELRLARSYARLGSALKEVKVQQYWIAYGFDKFSSYLESVWKTIGKKRSQVYAILGVAETLLPYLSENQLETIGIAKAHELKRLVKQGGNVNSWIPSFKEDESPEGESVQLMDYAADPKVTAAQLRVKVNELLHCHEAPQGTWYELGGFYAASDERKEIEQFWEVGRDVLEFNNEESEHVWKKEVFLAAVREAYSTWSCQLGRDEFGL